MTNLSCKLVVSTLVMVLGTPELFAHGVGGGMRGGGGARGGGLPPGGGGGRGGAGFQGGGAGAHGGAARGGGGAPAGRGGAGMRRGRGGGGIQNRASQGQANRGQYANRANSGRSSAGSSGASGNTGTGGNYGNHDFYNGAWNANRGWDLGADDYWATRRYGYGMEAWGLAAMFGYGAYGAYSNPYYGGGAALDNSYNYSQPIPLGDDTAAAATAPAQPAQPVAALPPTAKAPAELAPDQDSLDPAMAAFKHNDYSTALEQVDAQIRKSPADAVLHEFRALVLFAQKKYKDAAAGIYAVLSVGPGMNWETMSGLYANVDTYKDQLRALENYQRDNPDAPDGHFLLAYHYLVLGYTDQAVTQLEKFSKLVPTDKLAPELIKAFTQAPDTGKPKAEAG